ncbi:MAG TPA: EAL domain-containing protein [Thermoanaerobaculia bacterium]|nr:EAL domain-containing protein [Thermoanaerobaculia bacterium]
MSATGSPAALLLASVSLLVAAAVLGLGLWVAIRERWKAVGLQFAALAFLVSIWLGCAGFVLLTADPAAATAWARASYLGVALIPAAIYHFTARLLGRHREQQRTVALLWAAGFLLAALTQATGLVVQGIGYHSWGHFTLLAPPAVGVVVLYLGVLLSVFALFARELRSPEGGPHRSRAAAFCLAFGIASFGVLDFLPSFGWDVPPLGMLPVAAAMVMVALAILRFRLVDVTAGFAADKILETLQGAVLVCDLDERIRVANPAACVLLGYRRAELLGLRLLDVIETPRNVGTASDTLMRGGIVRDRPMIWRRRDRSRVEVEVSVSMMRDELGAPAGMVFVAGDISDRDRAAQIEYQAFHDPLTGLPNRTAFTDRLETRLATAGLRGARLAVLFLDLDGFKLINDSLGHGAGDRVLQTLARRLRRAVRDGDLVSRFGGDEFTVLLEIGKAEDAEAVAQKLLSAVSEPCTVEGERLFVTASLGVALYPENGDDPEALVRNADASMYAAKELGRNNYQFCGHGLSERARTRLQLEAQLRQALAENEFELHYQPIVELSSGLVVGVEGLLRWNRDGELWLPDRFLPVAEQTLLIRPIGDWVLRTACAQGVAWQERFGSFRIAVNVSSHHLAQPGIVDQIASLLDASGMPAHRLELEITEGTAMKDPERTREVLVRLKELGVRLALDDFGTGYSSLSYLQQFPLDTVKIDRTFVATLGQARGGLAIIRATLAMAQSLGLRVTAEGVETTMQLELLRELGCHYAQGFGLGMPMPPAELEKMVRHGGRRRATDERPILTLEPPRGYVGAQGN